MEDIMRKALIITIAAVTAAIGLACGSAPTAPGGEVPGPAETGGAHPARTVATITISGKGTAQITWSTGGNLGSQQADNVPLPWALPINSGIYSVVAQRKGSDAKGTIRCEVKRPDGSDVAPPMESNGAFAAVSCAGSV
jgi:hypothetical protein